ncbi:HD domain-containing protein [Deinococcus detaillensis]|uniref:HD domain-containing protein n=1 Tax=Deinococcus detaillensis TaxID=2592048 RepID=UPI001CDCC527|nr:HD domain-containing protein [Deinococcus detaillensis]
MIQAQALERIGHQVEFLLACDQLKSVARTTLLHCASRAENSAEHSWHLALMALTLAEYAPPKTDIGHAVKLLIVHDLVEVFAGDTHFDQSEAEHEQQRYREQAAAHQLFGLLPEDQRQLFHQLWQEFEARVTPAARFAKALDALQPVLLTWGAGAQGSAAHPELTLERVLHLKRAALSEFPALLALVERTLAQAVIEGILPTDH